MRKNFTDHAANERTFLAWIRTGIAVMAFGFLVEKFTLFLNYVRLALHQSKAVTGGGGAQVVGIALICLGVVMLILTTIRFKTTEAQIDLPEVVKECSTIPVIVLGVLLSLVGAFLAFYLSFQVS